MPRKLFNSNAFTLLETLIVIVVIGILIAISVPTYLDHVEARRVSSDAVLENTARIAYGSQYYEEGTDPTAVSYYNPESGKWVPDIAGIRGYGQCLHDNIHKDMVLKGVPVKDGYSYDVKLSWVNMDNTGETAALCSGMYSPVEATPAASFAPATSASFAPEPARSPAAHATNPIPTTPPAYWPLPVPGGFKFDDVGDRFVKVSWTACHTGLDVLRKPRYEILWENTVTHVSGSEVVPITSPDMSATISGLYNENTYNFTIRMKTDVTTGAESSIISETPITPPGKPVISKLDNSVDSQIKVSWSTIPGAAGYIVQYRRLGAELWDSTDPVTTNDTEFIVAGLVTDVRYEFRVCAYKTWKTSKICSPFSDRKDQLTVMRKSKTMLLRVSNTSAGTDRSIYGDLNTPIFVEYKSVGTDGTYKDIVASYRYHPNVLHEEGNYILGYSHNDYHTWGTNNTDWFSVDMSMVADNDAVICDPTNGGVDLRTVKYTNYDYSGGEHPTASDCTQRLYINRDGCPKGSGNYIRNYRGISGPDRAIIPDLLGSGVIFRERYHIIGFENVDPVYSNFKHTSSTHTFTQTDYGK